MSNTCNSFSESLIWVATKHFSRFGSLVPGVPWNILQINASEKNFTKSAYQTSTTAEGTMIKVARCSLLPCVVNFRWTINIRRSITTFFPEPDLGAKIPPRKALTSMSASHATSMKGYERNIGNSTYLWLDEDMVWGWCLQWRCYWVLWNQFHELYMNRRMVSE